MSKRTREPKPSVDTQAQALQQPAGMMRSVHTPFRVTFTVVTIKQMNKYQRLSPIATTNMTTATVGVSCSF